MQHRAFILCYDARDRIFEWLLQLSQLLDHRVCDLLAPLVRLLLLEDHVIRSHHQLHGLLGYLLDLLGVETIV